MTRRERMERRLERREEWAAKAKTRAAERFGAAGALADRIPMGQPILVGHHSERHARRDAERIGANVTKGVEETRLAERHASVASSLEIALERSVFSDDPDAPERLEQRITENEAKAEKWGAINSAWRKTKGTAAERAAALIASGVVGPKLAETISTTMGLAPWLRAPLDTTNLRARIRRDRARLAQIRDAQP